MGKELNIFAYKSLLRALLEKGGGTIAFDVMAVLLPKLRDALEISNEEERLCLQEVMAETKGGGKKTKAAPTATGVVVPTKKGVKIEKSKSMGAKTIMHAPTKAKTQKPVVPPAAPILEKSRSVAHQKIPAMGKNKVDAYVGKIIEIRGTVYEAHDHAWHEAVVSHYDPAKGHTLVFDFNKFNDKGILIESHDTFNLYTEDSRNWRDTGKVLDFTKIYNEKADRKPTPPGKTAASAPQIDNSRKIESKYFPDEALELYRATDRQMLQNVREKVAEKEQSIRAALEELKLQVSSLEKNPLQTTVPSSTNVQDATRTQDLPKVAAEEVAPATDPAPTSVPVEELASEPATTPIQAETATDSVHIQEREKVPLSEPDSGIAKATDPEIGNEAPLDPNGSLAEEVAVPPSIETPVVETEEAIPAPSEVPIAETDTAAPIVSPKSNGVSNEPISTFDAEVTTETTPKVPANGIGADEAEPMMGIEAS